MHAARWSQPGPGAVDAPAATIRTRKFDRLSLLARVIHLRADCIALASSASSVDEGRDSNWNKLLDQAETLGRDWAANDPSDARQLLPSLLTGLRDVAERFEDGYVLAARGRPSRDNMACGRKDGDSLRLTGICDACDSAFTFGLDDIAADEHALACPCCGQPWNP